MKWQIKIAEGSKNLTLNAEVIYTTYQIEGIKVTGEGVYIVLQNNRPLLVAIELERPLTWKTIEGEIKDPALLSKIKKEAENYLTNVNNRLTK